MQVKSAPVNPFNAESSEGRFDQYFKEYGVDKEVQTGLKFSGLSQKTVNVLKKATLFLVMY
jgi:hypothetical protein